MNAGPTRRIAHPSGPSPRRTASPPRGARQQETTIEVDGISVDLRNRGLAAFLAWLVPGLGHYYQGRRVKAAIFFAVILSTWFFGFAIGGGNVVYASWQPGDRRWHFIPQAGVGLAALPALIEGKRMNDYTDRMTGRTVAGYKPIFGGPMAPPHRPVADRSADQVASWYARRGAGYEMGTWYTIIAGLLNILVIYDAFGGPSDTPISGPKRTRRRKDGDGESESDPDPNAADPSTGGSSVARTPGTAESGMPGATNGGVV